MAVNSMATMAMRTVVTTWPCATWLTTPKGGMGAVGWMRMMP
jgi:hypothetical protein